MAKIKLNKDFLDLNGNILYGEKECFVLKANGDLAKVYGQFLTKTIETPEEKLELKKVCIDALLTDHQDYSKSSIMPMERLN